MITYDNPEQLRRQQLIQSVIMRYGMMYLDQLDDEELEQLIEEEDRYFE